MLQYPSAWLQNASLGETIACELRLRIINGTIKTGETISENWVASEFGTSRSPVREALKTLSSEGLIRLERMGAVVVGLDVTDVEELYDVRFLIESFAQQRLAQSDVTGLLGCLQRIVDKMELAMKHNDAVEFSYQDLSFHETIITAANHNRILHLWKSIRPIVMTVMLLTTDEIFSKGEQKLHSVIDKHYTIMKGLESRKRDVIEQVVREYFADSRKTLHSSIPGRTS
ncbi:GntR family transcriptional regulator [Paenibacillus cookii]|jgi:GntR family transcriptional regulator of gluconate operon|uniref:GntR family transcriptional regulator n=1 Tax=Paenibacillus cookii TaxID=157839 RepID=A0ABQ4M2T6_9BACL|nr:putative HTH-type transcriptional regulator YdfH [Paenibacillus sp. P1XP2]GIO69453.1 GntR family transcriptional regulator [Paenibacillus cookii]